MARYAIVPERSELAASARSSVHPIHADARPLTGWVEVALTDGLVDTRQPANARVELATAALRADNPLVSREVRRRLDTRTYPTARAVVHEVTGPAGGGYQVRGELTLRQVTRPVTARAVLVSANNGSLEITGELTLDVRDFQLEPPKLLGLRVHPEVAVSVRIVAETTAATTNAT